MARFRWEDVPQDPHTVDLLEAAEAKIQKVLLDLDGELYTLHEEIYFVDVDTRDFANMKVGIKTRRMVG